MVLDKWFPLIPVRGRWITAGQALTRVALFQLFACSFNTVFLSVCDRVTFRISNKLFGPPHTPPNWCGNAEYEEWPVLFPLWSNSLCFLCMLYYILYHMLFQCYELLLFKRVGCPVLDQAVVVVEALLLVEAWDVQSPFLFLVSGIHLYAVGRQWSIALFAS